MPEHHAFDFRQPSLVQEFLLASDSLLLMEFLLLVKGVKNTSLFSFFFHLNPGFDVYIGNIKVFNFKQHGINDEVNSEHGVTIKVTRKYFYVFHTCQKWHKYRLTMNKTELKQHLEESGEENLLITINVKINLKNDCQRT